MKLKVIILTIVSISLQAMETKQCDNYGNILTATQGTTLYAPWREVYQQSHNRKQDTTKKQTQPQKKDIFCRLIERDTKEDKKSLIVKRFKNTFIALPLQPYTPGHIMIIPIQHTGNLDVLSHEAYSEVTCYQQALIHVFLQNFGFDEVKIGLNEGHNSGASIPEHLHVHLVPQFKSNAFTEKELTQSPIKKNIHDTYAIDYNATEAKTRFAQLLNNMYDIIQSGLIKMTIPPLAKGLPIKHKESCHICIQPSRLPESIITSFKHCFVAFKNPNPAFLGHCIIAPHNHRKKMSQLSHEEKKELDDLTRKVNTAIKVALQPTGTNIGYTEVKIPAQNDHICVEVLPRFPEFPGFIQTLAKTYVITENVKTTRTRIITALGKLIPEKKD